MIRWLWRLAQTPAAGIIKPHSCYTVSVKLTSPITDLKGVADGLSGKLNGLGIHTVLDLITNYPRRYEDYSNVTLIKEIKPDQVTLEATINQVNGRYVRRGLHITEAIATDETGSVRLVWFN